ncbi:MAG: glutathione S-transferase [Methylomonas sp.]
MHPVLYSFRRCPYAMRARLAIASARLAVELREVELRNKPEAMLSVSPKGTVPVLILGSGKLIEESLDIMHWALDQHDPDRWLEEGWQKQTEQLIQCNDGEFKYWLDRYKYPDRYPEYSASDYRQQGERFLASLEQALNQHPYLCGDRFSLADAAIVPFIRQFVAVDRAWFETAAYPTVKRWLNEFLASPRFTAVMTKYLPWQPDNPPMWFGKG